MSHKHPRCITRARPARWPCAHAVECSLCEGKYILKIVLNTVNSIAGCQEGNARKRSVMVERRRAGANRDTALLRPLRKHRADKIDVCMGPKSALAHLTGAPPLKALYNGLK